MLQELRGDAEIVMAAVCKDPHALMWATEEVRGDRCVVTKAVSENGLALQWSAALKFGREKPRQCLL